MHEALGKHGETLGKLFADGLSANWLRHCLGRQTVLCREPKVGPSAKALPSANKADGKEDGRGDGDGGFAEGLAVGKTQTVC